MTPPPAIALTLVAGAPVMAAALAARMVGHAAWAPALLLHDDGAAGSARIAALAGRPAAGCACCRPGAFAGMLEGVVRAIDNGRATGVANLVFVAAAEADPLRLAGDVASHPYLARRFVMRAILTCLPEEATAVGQWLTAQIAAADVLAASAPDPWRETIDALNPGASILAPEAIDAMAKARFQPAARSEVARRRFFSLRRR